MTEIFTRTSQTPMRTALLGARLSVQACHWKYWDDSNLETSGIRAGLEKYIQASLIGDLGESSHLGSNTQLHTLTVCDTENDGTMVVGHKTSRQSQAGPSTGNLLLFSPLLLLWVMATSQKRRESGLFWTYLVLSSRLKCKISPSLWYFNRGKISNTS